MNANGAAPVLSLKKTETLDTTESIGNIVGRLVIVDYIGKTFTKNRFGQTTQVVLKEVGKRDVKLAEIGRVDTFRISISEFMKFYKPA